MIWLAASAFASGAISPDVDIIDVKCSPRALDEPLSPPIFVTGGVRGTTSAPGGPVMHHEFPLQASDLSITREGCRTPEPGRFVVVGACGEHVMLRYRGTLQPGVSYRAGPQGSWSVAFSTDGAAVRGGCPEDPLAFGAMSEKTWGESTTRTLSMSRDQLSLDADQHTLTLPREVFQDELGLAPLSGPLGHWVDDGFELPETVTVDVTLRPYRERSEVEGDEGTVWCELHDAVLVELALPDLGMKSTVGWGSELLLSRERGYCP
jgi:hypothetical protein